MLIQEYQEKWADDFEAIRRVIASALFPLNISIEHIGSTAIPNLAAKPIIDIDIIFDSKTDFAIIKNRLGKIGYFHNGDQGIPNREAFKRQESSEQHEVLDTIKHHLYVCPTDSEELQRHLLFRDFLRQDENARQAYQTIKYQIAEEAKQDIKIYVEIKELKARDFINAIIERAKQ